jgi:hypothetical protein
MSILAISLPIPSPLRALVAFATLISAVCTAAELPAAPERPEVAVGESWIYAGHQNQKKFSIKVEIEQLSDKEIRTIVTPNGSEAHALPEVFDRQWNHIERVDGDRLIRFSPYLPAFSFPLHIDKTWAKNYEWQSTPKSRKEIQDQKTREDRKQGGNRVEAKVLGWEEITVPAGTYTTVKVETVSPHYEGPQTNRLFAKKELFGGLLQTYWYAPKVKRFVKYRSLLYVNEKLVNSGGLDLVAYNEAPVAAAYNKGQGQQIMPPNAESEYLQTLSTGFSIDGNTTPTEIRYNIRLRTRKSLPEGAIAVLIFENPDPRAAPMEVVYETKPDGKEMFVRSPTVACIVSGRQYRVVVTLFADRERRDMLGTHEQMVAFFAPAEILNTVRVPDCRPYEPVSSGESRNLPRDSQFSGVGTAQLPIWQMDFPKDETWNVAHTQRKNNVQVAEYTAGSEKIESWSQLVTFAILPKQKTPEEFHDAMNSILSRISTDCSSPKSQILAKTEHMMAFRWSGENCGGLPAQEEVARYEYADAGTFLIKYTYYKEKAKPDFEAWVRRVIEAKVTQPIGAVQLRVEDDRPSNK